ncbi:thermonuclease family protein [Sulfuriroseicoccus oceanibius]|uniref:Thermonuclease family protein n=1 Tax=Sulfuriroseicoccus oceanibius TaxID=2707525 RepID=A0A6B3LA36_9BACT|nr:thermonuclease family protein [Sulfuriroseicoccus oceanibius]QQL43763.1 thermonuclease family protein [Sulfuriroseicoccus oceanibius]
MNQRPLLILVVLVCLVSVLFGHSAEELRGKVVRVADGDTITVLVEREQYKVRLDGIDAPEMGQAFGNRSKQALSGQVAGKQVVVKVNGKDKYGRTIGVVILDNTNVNEWMVAEGWAWQYTKYNRSERLARMEARARELGLGLWAGANPVAPWEYRPLKKKRPVSGYWLNTSSNTRHNSNCEWYENTARGRTCGKDEGKPCGSCGG